MFKFRKNRSLPLDPDEIFADSLSQLKSRENEEEKLERSLSELAGFIFLILITGTLLLLAGKGALLSLIEGEAMLQASQANRFLTRSVFPPRGLIYDKFGRLLVENVPTFTLLQRNSTQDEAILLRDLGRDEVINLGTQIQTSQDMEIMESSKRLYTGQAYAHVLGYVGRISKEELKENPELSREEIIGKAGLEKFYDGFLRGKRGRKIIEVNSLGQETRYKFLKSPQEGDNLYLNLDGELQEYIYATLQKNLGSKSASVVALSPRDGRILGLVSLPSFDGTRLSGFISSREFADILQNRAAPLFNRVISGEFLPGSTIKPFIAVAILEEKIADPQKKIYAPGFIEIPHPYIAGETSVFRDWKEHGWIDFYEALAQSSNVYFYTFGGGYKDKTGLGIERIKKYLESFFFGARLGIDLPGEKTGLVPDPKIKKILEPENPLWRVGDTYNISIGQGGLKVTPLQLASATAALANGGILFRPRMASNIQDSEGKVIKKIEPEIIAALPFDTASLEEVKKSMRLAVTSGTARLLYELPVPVAAKTGTAQVGSGLPHAWVTTFSPLENPEIVITVMVEHAGEGSAVAVPIAYEILKWYFENRH